MHEFLFLNDAQQLGLSLHADRPDFIKKDRSLISDFEQSPLRRDSARECSSHVPEQCAFQQVHRHTAAVYGYKRLVRPLALQMNCLRDKLFAGSALALDKNRAAACRNLSHQVEHFEYLFALTDDVAVAETFFQGATELRIFTHQLALFNGVINNDNQFFVVPGLCNVVERSFLDCGYRSFQRSDCCDNDDRQSRINPPDILLHFHAGSAGQHEVQQHGVVEILLDLFQTFFAVCGRICEKTLRVQEHFNALPDFLFIVNNEDDSFSSRHSLAS